MSTRQEIRSINLELRGIPTDVWKSIAFKTNNDLFHDQNSKQRQRELKAENRFILKFIAMSKRTADTKSWCGLG